MTMYISSLTPDKKIRREQIFVSLALNKTSKCVIGMWDCDKQSTLQVYFRNVFTKCTHNLAKKDISHRAGGSQTNKIVKN